MNRTIKAIVGVVFVLVICFSAISICQNIGKNIRLDATEQKLYTLSQGTKAILGRLREPVKIKLYYAETAAMKAPDQIRFFNNYYEFVKALLEEYVAQSNGMIELEVIDPRPFSEEEIEALRYGLKRFNITEEESFFFGLALQTEFGVEKAIPFFSPDRQNFIEYDISYLIDTAVTREKTRIGVLSSLAVMGDDMSDYMAQMRSMQGQRPTPPWTIVEQLRQQYDVKKIPADVNEIKDVDILLIIHPKELPEETLFAIDQFVLKGGRTIVCIDPHSVVDSMPDMPMRMRMEMSQGSNLEKLLPMWGLAMPEKTFAGDRSLALAASLRQNQRPEKIIGFLGLTSPACFNSQNSITSDLNQVRFLFSGILKETEVSPEDQNEVGFQRVPLLTTTDRGNSWGIDSPYELTILDAEHLMNKFVDGAKPVAMGYLVTGKFKSAFPDGIDVEVEKETEDEEKDESSDKDPNAAKETKHITGLKQAQENCAVVVFADVDFMSDALAYSNFFFGKVVAGDNSALLLNAIDDLRGSSDLIAMRSRGNFRRPFTYVDEIERQAEAQTAAEEDKINAEIAGFQAELQSILASAKEGQEEIVGSSILQKRKDLELSIHQAKRRLLQVKQKRRERIEQLGNSLRNFNMLAAPAVILVIAIILDVRRAVRKRHYISHASDA
jgi:ABC-type uncharacterized transport system involved in gliding motility auxiliary subunit